MTQRPGYLSLRLHAAILGVITAMIALHLLPRYLERGTPSLNLYKSWQVCVIPGEARPSAEQLKACNWLTVKGKVSQALLHGNEWLAYRSQFSAPEFCKSSLTLCTLLIGTMSDPTEGFLNGSYIGRVGALPPKTAYSQTYPASFSLAGLKPDANEVLLLSRPLNRAAHGMLRGPIGVFTADGARSIEEALIGETVILPLISALFMLVFCVAGAFNLTKLGVHLGPLRLFAAYSFVMALYLMSLTRIPREYLPLDVAYGLHFSLRFFSEFFLLGFIGSFLTTCKRTIRATQIVRGIYLTFALGLLVLLPLGHALFGEMDARIYWIYRLSVLGVDTFMLTYVIAIPLAFRQRATFPQFVPVFWAMALMQFWDLLALNGLVEDIYFVRIYPVPLALSLAWSLWQSGWKARREREIEAELGHVASQVAHDLRSPLALLGAVAVSSAKERSEESELLQLAIGRIREVSSALLDKYRASKADDLTEIKRQNAYSLESLIEPVLKELRGVLSRQPDSAVTLTFQGTGAQVAVDRVAFKRVLSNLLNNAVEALPERRGRIEVVVSNLKDTVQVDVKDSGVGIPAGKLDSLFERGASQGKAAGHGFGLSYAKEVVEGWQGKVLVSSEEGRGTVVSLRLPKS